MPIFLRWRRNSAPRRAVMSLPLISTLPLSGRSSRLIQRTSVDLPGAGKSDNPEYLAVFYFKSNVVRRIEFLPGVDVGLGYVLKTYHLITSFSVVRFQGTALRFRAVRIPLRTYGRPEMTGQPLPESLHIRPKRKFLRRSIVNIAPMFSASSVTYLSYRLYVLYYNIKTLVCQ